MKFGSIEGLILQIMRSTQPVWMLEITGVVVSQGFPVKLCCLPDYRYHDEYHALAWSNNNKMAIHLACATTGTLPVADCSFLLSIDVLYSGRVDVIQERVGNNRLPEVDATQPEWGRPAALCVRVCSIPQTVELKLRASSTDLDLSAKCAL